MSSATTNAASKVAKNWANGITRETYQQISERLALNPKNAINIAKEIGEMIPTARERQIYKLMYPLVQYESRPQLNYITREFILKPLFDDDMKLFRSPNQYSILMMSFGYQFITDPKHFKNPKEHAPQGPAPKEV